MKMPSWIPTTVASSLADLESLSKVVRQQSKDDPFGDALYFLANWLIVRSCGHIEITEQACVEDLFDRCFGSVVHHYVDSTAFRTGRNPNFDNLNSLLRQIDLSGRLASELKDFLSVEYQGCTKNPIIQGTYKNCLKTIVDGRNSIVHGYSFHITAETALEYSEVAKSISEWYLKMFEPQGDAEKIILGSFPDGQESINQARRQTAAQKLELRS